MNSALQPIQQEPLSVKKAVDGVVVYNFTYFLNNLVKAIFLNTNRTANFTCGFVLPVYPDLTSSPKTKGKTCQFFEREIGIQILN